MPDALCASAGGGGGLRRQYGCGDPRGRWRLPRGGRTAAPLGGLLDHAALAVRALATCIINKSCARVAGRFVPTLGHYISTRPLSERTPTPTPPPSYSQAPAARRVRQAARAVVVAASAWPRGAKHGGGTPLPCALPPTARASKALITEIVFLPSTNRPNRP